MCNHASNVATIQELIDRYELDQENEPEIQPIHHSIAFAYSAFPIITQSDPVHLQLYNWGLIPSWAKPADALQKRSGTVNARLESAFDLASFKTPIRSQRCIVPLTGFYEAQEVGKEKVPYFIHLRDEPIFSVAGLYEHWSDNSTGVEYKTFTMVTTEANELMAEIHNTKKRMPIILTRENEKNWLNPDLSQVEIEEFAKPISSDLMDAYKIGKLLYHGRTHNTNTPEVYKRLPDTPDFPKDLFS